MQFDHRGAALLQCRALRIPLFSAISAEDHGSLFAAERDSADRERQTARPSEEWADPPPALAPGQRVAALLQTIHLHSAWQTDWAEGQPVTERLPHVFRSSSSPNVPTSGSNQYSQQRCSA